MSVPRRKPWEVSSGTSSASVDNMSIPTSTGTASSTAAPVTANTATTATGDFSSSIPDRPTSLTSDLSNMSNTSPYGNSSYGSYGSRYGSGLGGSNMYGSSMYGNSYGGYGSSMYGMGGYGSSMYGMGGYGSSMYGMGGYGSGMMGQQGMMGPGGLGEGTQATFQLIESIIGAVGGFAQMLEATYMATHSSFFTMVSLAEQFGNLKNALGSILGIYALINFTKKIFYKLTGQKYNHGINLKEFSKFENKQKKLEDNLKRNGGKPRISFKPLLIFLAASIGLPYLLSKAIQKINEQQQRRSLTQQSQQSSSINPSNLQFAKAIYDFNSENPNIEIDLKKGDLVAILSKLDPLGNESKWWKVRSRTGKIGYVPSNFLSLIERKQTLEIPLTPSIPPQQQPQELVEEFKKFN
ncbi:peroxisomal membrane protein PAS20 [[Candida] jaroonii]|uniref:Peroxisomal membrane protein PAS20 n=1 Tax=[Candida] jaroonii TaxID=467808 RepID=A0ACA9Y8Q4_9ASCO|nr:peroxisomal membrane protein PAS20 [[Candida] jaroonii]